MAEFGLPGLPLLECMKIVKKNFQKEFKNWQGIIRRAFEASRSIKRIDMVSIIDGTITG